MSGPVRYIRVHGGRRRYVILEVGPGGEESFWEQEPGDVRWFPFRPSRREWLAARKLLEGPCQQGWGARINLDLPEPPPGSDPGGGPQEASK